MSKLDIVQFDNGQYAVRRKFLWFTSFLSPLSGHWWSNRNRVMDYCMISDLKQAHKLKARHELKIKRVVNEKANRDREG